MGIQATMEDGVITITSNQGNWVTGGILSSLGISTITRTVTTTTTKTTGTTATTGQFTYVKNENAKITDTIGSFVTVNGNQIITVKNAETGTDRGTVTITSGTTFESLFKALDDYGVQATMEDGVITITSNQGNWVTGGILSSLGISTVMSTITTTTTKTIGTDKSTSTLTYSKTETAKITDKLSDYISVIGSSPSDPGIVLAHYDSAAGGASIGTILLGSVSASFTFEDLFKELANNGIQATMEDGVITVNSTDASLYIAGGWIADRLGISYVSTNTTITVGKSTTSSAAITYTTSRKATEEDKVLGFTTYTVASTLTVCDNKGSEITTITVGTTMTFGELFNALANYDIDGDIHDGVIKLTSVKGNIVQGDVATALNLNTTTIVTTKTVGGFACSSGAVTYKSTVAASGSTELSQLIGTYKIDGTITESGVTGTVIGISTAQDLVNLSKLVNAGDSMTGKTFVMTRDIDMSSVTNWTKIGVAYYFMGNFDGNGHTISNLNLDVVGDNGTVTDYGLQMSTGLFSNVLNSTIKNITLSNFHADNFITEARMNQACVGFLIANKATNSTISGIKVVGAVVKDLGCAVIQGVFGNTRIENCNTDITWSNTTDNPKKGSWVVSGLVGSAEDGAYITVYGNSVTLNASGYIFLGSGLVGYHGTGNTTWNISNCEVNGNIESYGRSSKNTSINGIIGAYADSTFSQPLIANINIDHCVIKANLKANEGYVNYIIGGNYNKAGSYAKVNVNGVIASGTKTLTGNGVSGWVGIGSNSSLTDEKNNYSYNATNTTTSLSYENMRAFGFNSTIWSLSGGTLFSTGNFQTRLNVYDKDDKLIKAINMYTTSTLNDLIDALKPYGTASLSEEGYLSFTGTDGNYISGSLADLLGISTVASTKTVTIGRTLTSTVGVTYTSTTVTETRSMSASATELWKVYYGNISLGSITSSGVTGGSIIAINTKEDLINLQKLVNEDGQSMAGKNFLLMNDIDMSDVSDWVGIGNSDTSFEGSFDGLGHKISNLTINYNTSSPSDYLGLFGYTDGNNTFFKNVILDNFNFRNIDLTTPAGALIGHLEQNSTISGITVTNFNVSSTGSDGSNMIGGVIGHINNGATISDCDVTMNIDGHSNDYAGGIVGYSDGNVNINKANVSITSTSTSYFSSLGGIIGYSSTGHQSISNVFVDGTLTISKDYNGSNTYLGGIIGYGEYVEVNSAVINADAVVGADTIQCAHLGTATQGFFDNVCGLNSTYSHFDNMAIGSWSWKGTGSYYQRYDSFDDADWFNFDNNIWKTGPSTSVITTNDYSIYLVASASSAAGNFSYTGSMKVGDIPGTLNGQTWSQPAYSTLRGGLYDKLSSTQIPMTETVTTETVTVQATLTTDTTIEQLGSYYAYAYVDDGKGNVYTISVTATGTVGDLFTALAAFDIYASIDREGKVQIQSLGDAYISSCNLDDIFHFSDWRQYITVPDTTYTNTPSKKLQETINAYLTSDTFLGDLGCWGDTGIKIVDASGHSQEARFYEDNKLQDVISWLAAYNISAFVDFDWKFTINGSSGNIYSDYWLDTTDLSTAEFLRALKMSENSEDYKTTITSSTLANTTSKDLTTSEGSSLSTSTKLSELGVSSAQTVTVVNNGTTYTVTFSTDSTVDDIISALAGYGVAGSVNEGKLTLTGTKDGYITGMSDALKTALNLSVGSGNSYQTSTNTTYSNTLSNKQQHNVTHNVDATTTITTTMGTGTIAVNYQGTAYNVTVSAGKTIGDVMNELAGFGISGSLVNGVLKFTGTGDGYVTAWNGAFGLTGSSYSTATTSTTITTGSNTLSNRQNHNRTYNADATTTITTAMGTGTINVRYEGNNYNVTVSAGKTIGDVMNELAGFGISGSLVNGVLKFTGTGDGYVTNWNGAFGLSGASYGTVTTSTTITTGSNTLSNRQNHNRTYNAEATTTITTAMGTGTINVRYEGNNYNVTVSAGKTIGDVMNELAGFGISGSLVNGVLKFTGTADGYVTAWNGAFGLTGASYSTATTSTTITTGSNTLSNRQNHNRTYNAEATTTITTVMGTGTINVRYEGNNYNVTVSAGKTIGDVMNELAGFGISGSLVNGVLKFTGTGDGYVTNWGSAFGLTGASYGTVTTSTTITTGSNTLSNRQNHNVTYDAQATTKISQTSAGKGTITVNYQGNTYNVTVSGDKTIGDIMNELAGYGISGSLQGGVLKFQGTGDGYVTNWGGAFGLTGASYGTVTTSTTITTGSNTLSNRQNHNVTYDAQATTKISQTSAGKGTITVNYQGNTYNVTVSGDKTIGDVMNELAGYGISGSLKEGVLKFQGTGDGYVTNWGGAFGLTGASYGTVTTSTTITTGSNTLSNRQNHNVTYDAQATTKISQTSAGKGTITVNYQGNTYYVTVSDNKTIGDIMNELAGYGISGSLKEGVLKFQGTGDGYVTNWGGAFGLTGASYGTVTTSTTITTGSNTLSNRQNHNVTYNANATTKMSQTSAGLGTMTVNYEGKTYYVTATADKTIGEILNELAGYGISGSIKEGVIKLQGTNDGYITNAGGVFGLTGSFYGTTTVTIKANKTSNDLSYTSANVTLTTDTKISAINGYSGGSGSLIIHKTDGTYVTISVDATKTLGEFFTQLSQYGLVGRVDDSGKVSIDGIGNVYMQQASGGSNILTALKLSNVRTNVKTVTVNRTSDTLHHTITVAASGTTQLGNLQLSNGTGINFTGNNAALILRTTSDAGNKFVTINFSKTQSIYDVIAALANYGIDARIDSNGRFSMSSSTLTDFEISGALGTFLMGTYSKKYGTDTTYNTSTNLLETTTVFMKDSDALSTFGVTGGNIIINQEGVKYTVNVDTTQIRTVGDFRNLLSKYGFNSYIDDHGRLNVEGIGNSTLEQITGGSNILDKFGLLDWTLGEITQNSDHLTDTEVITRRISMSDKLKDLTNSSGVNLGITAGQIYVYQDGTRSTLNIDVNDTLETLQAKLAQYGITVGISQNGQLYFDGNNDSYLTTNGISSSSASNILQKFGISGTWSTRYDSTSEKLDYTTTSNNVVTGSTKLKDLNGADGKNLGITTGAFYVYNSGVRTTEQIEEDMTVNDLMATLAKYGLVADIDENGSISVGAYNNTYLATSALSSANSNIVSTLFAQWDFVNIYKSNHLDIPTDEIRAITRDTKLSDINEGTYKAGYITVVKDGVKTNISLTADDTVGTLMDELALYGFESVINDKGQLMIKNTGDSLLQNYSDASKASNALTLLGIDLNNWINTNTYESGTLDVTKTSTIDAKATRDTLLSQLGVTTGEYYIYNNGVKYTAMISSDETIGSFMDTLKSFGIETSLVEKDGGSVLTIVGKGDSYLKKSTSTTNSSNVVEQLFKEGKTAMEYSGLEQTSSIQTTFTAATEDTLVSYFDKPWNGSKLQSEGDLTVVVNGQKNTIKITADDTFGSLLEKFRALGIEATMSNGQIMLQSGYDTLTITPDGTTSNLLTNIKLVYDDDLGGYSASNVTVKSTTTNIEEKTLSVANYANSNTKLSDLNISEGTLTIYRDGIKAQINIDENDTFTTLQSRISEKFNKDNDVIVTFEDGYLKIYSKSGKNIEVGATSDSSNFGAITGIASDGTGVAKSARELYCVIGDSKITANGLFRRGNVKAGTFTVGDAVFTITNDTKLSDLISQINSSDTANATAFWDNVEGKLVIKSRTTGAALVNIEAGTSNFTDIMGFTSSQWNGDGSLKTTKMNIDTQEIGDNAKIKINGTTYTSTSNNITSDVTRIKGLTINLKGLTKDSSVTLKVERDKETLANAVSSVVDSYNELMKNVDEAIASDGDLKNESTLKLIRNQLRNLMTSSDAGTTVFRNLDSIGIGASSASGSNISTANSAIISLTFDKDKFLKAYEADQDAVKELIIGGANNKGVFTKVEDLVESTLKSVSGYFASTETSYTNKIRDLDKKITKANKEVDRYKARLEAKFQSMDMLIAQMQQQYSSFLKT